MRKLIASMVVGVFMAIAFTPSAVRAQSAAEPAAPAIKSGGFWLETKLRTAVMFGVTGGAYGLSSYALPGFVIGGKFGRIVFGLGMDLLAYDSHTTSEDAPARNKWFGFVLGPVVQIILATKGALAAYVQGAVGFRYVWGKEKYWGDVEKTTNMGPAFNFALGFRYFLHPSFALGTEFGASVDVTWTKFVDNNNPAEKARTTFASFFGALTAAVVW